MSTQAQISAVQSAVAALVAGSITQPEIDAVNAAAAALTPDVAPSGAYVVVDAVHGSISGGTNTSAPGVSGAVALGENTIASGDSAVALGHNARAYGTDSIAFASGCISTGDDSVAIGYSCLSDAPAAWANGSEAWVRGIQGAYAWSSGAFQPPHAALVRGTAQYERFVLKALTTDATQTQLATVLPSAGLSTTIVLPDQSTYAFKGVAAALDIATCDSAAWEFKGRAKRGVGPLSTVVSAASPVLLGIPDPGTVAWALAIAADTSNGSIAVTFTGQGGKTIQVVATVETTENVVVDWS